MSAKKTDPENMTVAEAVSEFTALWKKGEKKLIEAAVLYYKAVYKGNAVMRKAFRTLPGFEGWSERNWRRLYNIGAGALSPLWLRSNKFITADTMMELTVGVAEQEDVLSKGLNVWNGVELVHVKPNVVTEKQIRQCFDEKGNRRNLEEQKKWFNENLKKETRRTFYFDNNTLVVRKKCAIRKTEFMQELMLRSGGFLDAKDCKALYDFLSQQEKKGKRK